ncbi:XdhC family protein [Granulosicoccus antarcticus]|nr:XdhC family protein [Granulosicoccus antarcticus]
MKNSTVEVLEGAAQWLEAGHGVELVTVVRTWGSSPRPVGSIAAVRDDGVLVGSVSGGCVEKQLSESFRGQGASRIHTHKVDDEQAKRFGLACGGELELVFETLADAKPLRELLQRLSRRERVRRNVSIGDSEATLHSAARDDQFMWDGENLNQVFGPAWRLLLVGAGQLSRFTAEFALAIDFDVLVVDPREQFREAWNNPLVPVLADSPDDAVLAHANDANSAVLALTHDPNIDDLALMEALPGECFYVGALGSVRNYEKRVKRLAGLDVPAAAIARLRGPIGLSIGSRTSAEIAISIMAELIQVRHSLA